MSPVSRRAFLDAIAAALVLDPERALWVPGAKKIFLPPAPRAGLLVPPEVARAALFNLGDVVTFGGDNNRYVISKLGHPVTHEGTQFIAGGPYKAHLESPMHQQYLQHRLRMAARPPVFSFF